MNNTTYADLKRLTAKGLQAENPNYTSEECELEAHELVTALVKLCGDANRQYYEKKAARLAREKLG